MRIGKEINKIVSKFVEWEIYILLHKKLSRKNFLHVAEGIGQGIDFLNNVPVQNLKTLLGDVVISDIDGQRITDVDW